MLEQLAALVKTRGVGPLAGAPLVEPRPEYFPDPWGGGDSYFTYPDPTDPDVIYYEHQFGDLRRKNMVTGEAPRIRPQAAEGEPQLRSN